MTILGHEKMLRSSEHRTAVRFAAVTAIAMVFGLLASPAASRASTPLIRHVDEHSPTCTSTSGGSSSAPYCSVQAAASAAQPGESVLVASGAYTESVTINHSGTEGAPISFAPEPGADVTLSGQSHAFTVSGTTTTPTSWIRIAGFHITATSQSGIYLKYASHVTLEGNHVTYSGQPVSGSTAQGIYLLFSTDSFVLGNTTDHNSDAGIYVSTGTTRVELRDNTSFANARQYTRAAPGIDIRAPGNIVTGNRSYGNEDSGIQVYGARDNIVTNNLSYNNGDHGIDLLNSSNAVIVSNNVYRNATAGINVEGNPTSPSSGATVRNNISVDNGLTSSTTKGDIRVDANSTPGTTADSDMLSLSSTGILVTWGASLYKTVGALRSATGQETHGLDNQTGGNPRWVNPGGGDFHLQAGSRAIDSADSNAPNQSATDADGLARVDDPATADSGLGPRTYDDRGALEFIPGAPTGESPPTASLALSPQSGPAPLTTTADAAGSTDFDGTPIASYGFTFGDGTAVGPHTAATASHQYLTAGTYPLVVTITDTAGLSSTASATVTVADIVGNPGFETDTNGWNFSGRAGVTLTRVADPHSGSFSASLTNASSSSVSDCTLNDAPNWVEQSSSGTYTASMWVKANSVGAKLTLRLREYMATSFVGQALASITLSTTWQQISVTYRPATPGSTIDDTAYVLNAAPGGCFLSDDAAVTRSET